MQLMVQARRQGALTTRFCNVQRLGISTGDVLVGSGNLMVGHPRENGKREIRGSEFRYISHRT